jgi:hypothetical protein
MVRWREVTIDITTARDPAEDGWVEVPTDSGEVTILASPGVPIWFEGRGDSREHRLL